MRGVGRDVVVGFYAMFVGNHDISYLLPDRRVGNASGRPVAGSGETATTITGRESEVGHLEIWVCLNFMNDPGFIQKVGVVR